MKRLVSILAVSALAFTTLPGGTASAAIRCEMHTKTCIDGRTGQARVCITTVCRDEGEIVSIDTIVLKDGGSPRPVKPKLPRSTVIPEEAVK